MKELDLEAGSGLGGGSGAAAEGPGVWRDRERRELRLGAAMAKQYDSVECPFCDEVTKYEKLAKIGQGTFGEVCKAKHRQTGQKVALKKVLMENEKEGFPTTALRGNQDSTAPKARECGQPD